jgi:hypothetical protein
MSFNLFEASASSDVEARLEKQASVDKLAAAIYDCKEKLGPALFASATIEEFRHKVAMMKNDQSVYKIIGAHLDPVSGVVRRVVGKGGALEKEFKAILATGITASDDDDSDKDDGFGGKKAPPFGSKDSRRHEAWPGRHKNDGYIGGPEQKRKDDQYLQDQIRSDPDHYPTDAEDFGIPGSPLNSPMKRKEADFTGDQKLKKTFKPSDGELIPEDNFDGYLNKVDQNSDKVKSHVFAMYTDWAAVNRLDPRRKATVLAYTGNNKNLYLHLARTIQGWDFSHQPKAPSGQSKTKLKDVTAYNYPPSANEQDDPAYHEPKSHEDIAEWNQRYPKDDSEEARWRAKEHGSPWASSPDAPGHTARRDPMQHYIGWCKKNGYKRLSARNIEIYAQGNPQLCIHLAKRAQAAIHTAYQRQAAEGGGNPYYHPNTVDPAKMWNNFNELDTSGHDPRQHQANGDGFDSFGGGDGFEPLQGQPAPNHPSIGDGLGATARRTAAQDYLQKANDALTQLLNQKAEEFQETIAPLQQALVTVQQATQIQQQQNPMNVLPPPGTVNVMPGGDQGPAGMPAAGAQDLGPAAALLAGGGGDPSGGGAPGGGGPPTPGADPGGAAGPGGPPPAAAGGGLPPEMDPAAQKAARRGGQGKARGAARPRQGAYYDEYGHHSESEGQQMLDPETMWTPGKNWGHQNPDDPHGLDASGANQRYDENQARWQRENAEGQGKLFDKEAASVGELWNKWNQQNTGIGGEADYQNFQQQFGVGDQAMGKLKQRHQTQGPDTGIIASEQPNMAEEASKSQWRQMDSRMSELGYKFDSSANHWMKPGQMPIRNHWQHTGGWGDGLKKVKDWGMSEPKPFADTRPGHEVQHLKDKVHQFGDAAQQASERWQNGHGGLFEDQNAEERLKEKARFSSRKQAWTGWGPAVFPKARQVQGWNWDSHLNGYLANQPRHFECSCGQQFPAPSGFHRCSSCGTQWNSYVIGTGGSNHNASADKFLVREIPVRPDVIMANRKLAGLEGTRLVDRSGNIHTLVDPGEVDPDGGTDAGTSTFKQQPKDWARRGDGAKWQKSPIGK